MTRPANPKKAAVLADYLSGYSGNEAAGRHGVSTSTAHKWITRAGISRTNGNAKRLAATRKRDQELGLTGGRWVNVRGVQRWVPFVVSVTRPISDQQRRVQHEETLFTDAQARAAHARFFSGCRRPDTVLGERVYQRRKKREQRARKEAA